MNIPKEVQITIEKLKKNGFEAYIVGGCVRDILRDVRPKDWDITTNAKPEEIEKIFPKHFYDNKFGTVTVQIKKSKLKNQNDRAKFKEKESKKEFMEIEITPFRIEEKYTDKRHPDKVRWAKTIRQDLGRRDFTVNAMAAEIDTNSVILRAKPEGSRRKSKNHKILRPAESGTQNDSVKIIDPFKGREDLKSKIIRAVGKAEDRFSEDALRMMRAVRFAVTLEPGKIWQIEEKTFKAIQKNAHLLEFISKERIRDELIKIIMSPNGARGIEILRRAGLLHYIIPELKEGFGVSQNKHHIYQVYEHNLLSLNYACQRNFSKYVRLAALLHDVGKPRSKQGEGTDSTFYNHEIIGAKMTFQILRRLKFSKKDIEKVVKLVRYHLFYYNVGEVGESSVRRLLRKVGREDIDELLEVRQADRIGSGVPKAEPYKLRHLRYLFEKVSRDPLSVKMLKVSGDDVMRILDVPPCPKVGQVLSYLLGQVMSDPKKNVLPWLKKEIKRLGQMSDSELAKSAAKSKKEIEKIEQKRDEMTKKKYWVS